MTLGYIFLFIYIPALILSKFITQRDRFLAPASEFLDVIFSLSLLLPHRESGHIPTVFHLWLQRYRLPSWLAVSVTPSTAILSSLTSRFQCSAQLHCSLSLLRFLLSWALHSRDLTSFSLPAFSCLHFCLLLHSVLNYHSCQEPCLLCCVALVSPGKTPV